MNLFIISIVAHIIIQVSNFGGSKKSNSYKIKTQQSIILQS